MTDTFRHVFASPVGADFRDPPVLVGTAATIEEAVKVVKEAGYNVIEEGNGGDYESYDAEDGPGIYGYESDGIGAYSISVKAI